MPVDKETIKGILRPLLESEFKSTYSGAKLDENVTVPTDEMKQIIDVIANSVAGAMSQVLSSAIVIGACPPTGGPLTGGKIV